MKVNDLIAVLQKLAEKHGNIEVMSADFDANLYGVSSAYHRVAEKNEFPKDWKMPKGFEFIELTV